MLTPVDMVPLPVTDLKHVMREINAMRGARAAIDKMRREDCIAANRHRMKKLGLL